MTTTTTSKDDPQTLLRQRSVGDNMAELHSVLDTLETANGQIAGTKKRRVELERWALDYAAREELDAIRHEGLTVTIEEKPRATYEPAEWESMLLALVGIDLEKVGLLLTSLKNDAELGGADDDTVIAAVRQCLTPGNLHILKRGMLVATKIEQLIMDGTELPKGVGIEIIKRVAIHRASA